MLARLHLIGTLAFVLVSSIASSCSQSSWQRLDSNEILEVLPELSLLSASLSDKYVPDSTRQRAYQEFFARRGYTLADWDSTMAWYARNRVSDFYDFHRLTGDSLTNMRTAMEHRRDSIALKQERERLWRGAMLDSVNLLNDSSTYYSRGEWVNRYFTLNPVIPYDSTTQLTAKFLILGLDSHRQDSLILALRLHFSDSTSLIQRQTIVASGDHRATIQVPNGKRAIRFSGWLRGLLPSRPDSTRVWISPIQCRKYSSGSGASATSYSYQSEAPYMEPIEDWTN